MAASTKKRSFVCGVGMTKFEKPGRREDFDYPVMVKECVEQALLDAGLDYSLIQQAAIGYCYGESTCGQRALYEFGLTGIPMYNVNNNCATGSTALVMAKQLVEGGIADCVLAVGFEKMERGSLGLKWNDRTIPMDKHVEALSELYDISASPMTCQIFANAGREHMEKYGTKPEHFAKIAEKNHRHSAENPRSQFRDVYTLEQVMNSREVHAPMTKLQCCPTSDGGAAAIVCSEEFMLKHQLQQKAVEILSMELATDTTGLFDGKSAMKIAGQDMTFKAARDVFRKAGLTPNDVQVVELHDCFAANELITYEALGLCEIGKAGEFIDRGDNTYGGKYVINPSGGLISKGHPLGATGLAQCFELCNQLRGECGKRQVKNAHIALQHNLGLGGACVVALYKKYKPLKIIRKKVLHKTLTSKIRTAMSSTESTIEKSFMSDAVFTAIANEFLHSKDKAAMLKKYNTVFCFELTNSKGEKGIWVIDMKNKGELLRGKQTGMKTDCTIKVSDENCFKMMQGKLNPQSLFMQGKLKVSGNMSAAMKLQSLRPKQAKL